MNRFNPAYVALFLLVVFFVVLYQNHKLEAAVEQSVQRLHMLEEKAKEISTLKSYWGDRKLLKKRVQEIVRTPFVSKFIKHKEEQRDRFKLFLEKVDASSADRIGDKIFNSFVKIGGFKIVRKDKNHIDMEVEFRF